MNKRLCVATYVSGSEYQEFIPVYIYSILCSYPDYFVFIFCGEKIKQNVRKSIDILEQIGNFKIFENHLPGHSEKIKKGVAAACKRWLLYISEFLDFDFLYIGDVDIFILPEKLSLLDQHLIHCQTLKLDYSNVRRRASAKRMSGLHFVKVAPYFKKMLPIINKYSKSILNEKSNYEVVDDEAMLFDMVNESGLGLCPQATSIEYADPRVPSFRPYHGIHLAVFRDLIVKKRRVISYDFQKNLHTLKDMIDEPLFKKIEMNFDGRLIKRIFKRIHNFSFN